MEERPFLILVDAGDVFVHPNEDVMIANIGALGGGAALVRDNLKAFQDLTQNNLRICKLDEMFAAGQQLFGLHCEPQKFQDAWNGCFTRMPQMEAIIPQLAEFNRLVVASNTNFLHWNYLEQNGFVPNGFKAVYRSDVMGVKKPDPQFYRNILETEGYSDTPERVAFIDDKSENVHTANTLRINGFVFTGPEKMIADLHAAGARIPPALLLRRAQPDFERLTP